MEQRMDQLEKRNKRLTVALTMTVVTVAWLPTDDKDGHFDTVWAYSVVAENIWVSNDVGTHVVGLGADSVVGAYDRKGKGRTLQPGP